MKDPIDDRTFPKTSLPALVDFLAAQAKMALGVVNHPQTEAPVIDLRYAKYAIDLLTTLEEKTAGNLDPNEKRYLEDSLYQLRMIYIRVDQAVSEAEKKQNAENEADAETSDKAPGETEAAQEDGEPNPQNANEQDAPPKTE